MFTVNEKNVPIFIITKKLHIPKYYIKKFVIQKRFSIL